MLLEREDIPFRCHDMYNAGCIKIDGEYLLLITIEKLDGRPAIFRARSEDGLFFEDDPGKTAKVLEEQKSDSKID